MAPLLILKQTLRSPRAQSSLVLRGPLINAGSFSDISNAHDRAKPVTFSLRFRPHLDSDTPSELGSNPPAECSITFRAGRSPGVIDLYQYTVADSYGRTLLSRTRETSSRYSLDNLNDWAWQRDQPEITDSPANQAAERAMQRDTPFHFLFQNRNIWNQALSAVASDNSLAKPDTHQEDKPMLEAGPLQLSSSVARYSRVVEVVEHYIREHTLADIVYLGPLRDVPRRLYQVSGDAPPDVGVRGQYSAELLLRNTKQVVSRIERWMREFGLPGRIACHRLPDTETAFMLVLQDDSSETNFADVGFGFSQLLPLLVQGSIAKKNTLVITEQPEIHLNPRLQTHLASFFQDMVKRGVAVMAESHSEHLLLATRRLIAERKLRSNDVAIYYVECENGLSRIRQVPLQADGHIESDDWPANFFDDTLRESLRLASAQARSRRA